jgi:hypothetical protein
MVPRDAESFKTRRENHYFDNFISTNKNTFWEPCGNPHLKPED